MANSRLYPCTAIIGILFGTTVASAADLPARPYTKAPPLYHAPISWTGCYLGGNIGAGWDRFNAGEVGFAGMPTPFLDYGSNNGSGLRGGGQIGCDYQFASNWVIGIQGKAEFGDINSSNPVAAFPGITAAFKLKNTETLTARLGYAFAPTVLGYVKGGAAWANAYAAATALGLAGETASFNMTGYAVGGGVCARLVGVRRVQLHGFRDQERQLRIDRLVAGLWPGGCARGHQRDQADRPGGAGGRELQVQLGGPVVARY